MKVFIIIVTYNGMKWLARCLESTTPYPVIVVDNNSTDGTVDYIKSHYPEIILFEQKENLGFGQANNNGISYALDKGADFVFLLNQDAYLFPDTIENLIKLQKQNSKYGILSPVHINNDEDKLDANFSNYISFHKNPYLISDFVLRKPLKEIYPVPFVNAAAWLISKNCLQTVGGFDPIFFHYGEDDNYCQRLKFHDYKIGVTPNEFVIHDRSNRSEKPVQPYTEDYLFLKERGFKIQYANINQEDIYSLTKNRKRLKKSLIKSLIFVRFRLAKYYLMELKMLDRIIPEIENSRRQNKEQKTNYLELNN
ncbi:glycosyltransferase family 2 protein [Salegentibacter mishustinae]|uniref:glycosyltransferase family 2 protein n=1 Tax=Salegentibacter mishustinae TaxID=270918 RepID=UPI001CE116C5|nr:glycosyltransferase family 2 protein [Salegentibacter mishustinae]UBZ07456.1 glycosyltransferase family 2 protein [Salegentibacter mishustinae]